MKNILQMSEIEEIKNNEWVILSTSNNDKPRAIECDCEILYEGQLFNEIKIYEEKNNLPEELKVQSIIVAKYCNIEISEG